MEKVYHANNNDNDNNNDIVTRIAQRKTFSFAKKEPQYSLDGVTACHSNDPKVIPQDNMSVVTQAYANFVMGSPQVISSLSVLDLPLIIMLLLLCLLFTIRFLCGCSLPSGAQHFGLHHCNPM